MNAWKCLLQSLRKARLHQHALWLKEKHFLEPQNLINRRGELKNVTVECKYITFSNLNVSLMFFYIICDILFLCTCVAVTVRVSKDICVIVNHA